MATNPDSRDIRDLLLVALTISTGAVDAISWPGLGKVFSAFMTGNLAFLGFRVGGALGPLENIAKPITAVDATLVGGGLPPPITNSN